MTCPPKTRLYSGGKTRRLLENITTCGERKKVRERRSAAFQSHIWIEKDKSECANSSFHIRMYSLIVIFEIFHETCSVTMCGQSHQRYHECRKPFVYHVDHIYYRCRTLKDCDLSLFCVTWRYVIRFRRIKSEIKEKGNISISFTRLHHRISRKSTSMLSALL